MPIQSNHWTDAATEAPEGGQTYGPGFAIAWQRGALVIKAAIDRNRKGN